MQGGLEVIPEDRSIILAGLLVVVGNGEAVEVMLRCCFGHRDSGNPCMGRAMAAPVRQSVYRIRRSFKACLDRAVGQIPNPAEDMKFIGNLFGMHPKTYPLHFAADLQIPANYFSFIHVPTPSI